jgi:D-alanyl-D-alanine carboxypeptidase (penicillin-binding protein 5/6)
VEASRLLVFWRDVQLFFEKPIMRILPLVLLALIILLVLWLCLFARRRRRYGRSSIRRRSNGYRGRRRR